jgi:hypothetical protein
LVFDENSAHFDCMFSDESGQAEKAVSSDMGDGFYVKLVNLADANGVVGQ